MSLSMPSWLLLFVNCSARLLCICNIRDRVSLFYLASVLLCICHNLDYVTSLQVFCLACVTALIVSHCSDLRVLRSISSCIVLVVLFIESINGIFNILRVVTFTFKMFCFYTFWNFALCYNLKWMIAKPEVLKCWQSQFYSFLKMIIQENINNFKTSFKLMAPDFDNRTCTLQVTTCTARSNRDISQPSYR